MKIHISYISLIIIIISSSIFFINKVENNLDNRCWKIIKEIAESEGI